MGSVPHLYTTGDNDPEIEPVQYYRHYLYCDACGSFDLAAWMAPEDQVGLERTRSRLAMAALLSLPAVLVSAWLALGLYPSPTLLVILAAAVVFAPLFRRAVLTLLLRGTGAQLGEAGVANDWRFVKAALLWLPLVALVQWAASAVWPPSWVLVAALVVVVGLLVARGVLGSKTECVGMRCRQCGSTYAHGAPFFTDLAANPRHLTVADVPRPLGSSPFSRGESVAQEPPEQSSTLPS